MLTEDERELVGLAFHQGPSALVACGMDYPEIKKFIERKDVTEEFNILAREFDNQETMNALTRFVLRRKLTRMSDTAVDVIGRCLRGPEYIRIGDCVLTDANGVSVIRNPEPTNGQQRAAMDVLDRLNVISTKDQPVTAGVNVQVMFKQAEEARVEIKQDPKHTTEEERSISRERVRNVIEVLGRNFDGSLQAAQKLLTGKKPRKKSTSVKKRPKKKKVGKG